MTRTLRLTAALVACAAGSSMLSAGDDFPYPFWTDRDGDWSNAASWSTGEVPDETNVIINNGATVTLDTEPVLFSMVIGIDGPTNGLGPFADTAQFIHPAGVHLDVLNSLLIGDRGVPDGPSTYTLMGTLNAASIRVGHRGNGLLKVGPGSTLDSVVVQAATIIEPNNPGLGNGGVVIEGPGTAVSIERELIMGERGEASFTLSGGATLQVPRVSFAASTPEAFVVEITGPGTELIVSEGQGGFPNGVAMGETYRPVIPADEIAPVLTNIADGAVVHAAEGNIDARFTVAGPSVLRGDGTVEMPIISFTGGARIAPGGEDVGSLTLDGVNEWRADERDTPPVFAVRLGDRVNDHVTVRALSLGPTQSVSDQVTLEVSLLDGYEPQAGERFEIITITDQGGVYGIDAEDELGFFTTLDIPDLGPDLIIRPVYFTNRIELRVACPADINANGRITSFDLFEFVDHYIEGNPVADLTLDGRINFDDIDAFVESFLNGC